MDPSEAREALTCKALDVLDPDGTEADSWVSVAEERYGDLRDLEKERCTAVVPTRTD